MAPTRACMAPGRSPLPRSLTGADSARSATSSTAAPPPAAPPPFEGAGVPSAPAAPPVLGAASDSGVEVGAAGAPVAGVVAVEEEDEEDEDGLVEPAEAEGARGPSLHFLKP